MKNIFLILIFAITADALGQNIDYNKIILPPSTHPDDFGERLVQLAWQNNPNNKVVLLTSQDAHYDLKQAQWSWLDYIRVQGNLNEFTLNPGSNERAAFYPRYNFSIFLPLGALAHTPLDVKKRRVELSIADEQVKAQKLHVRAEVLRLYEQYQLLVKQLDRQKRLEEIINGNYIITEQKFKTGEESITVYNNISERKISQELTRMSAEAQLKTAKINLEEVVGVKLEDIPR